MKEKMQSAQYKKKKKKKRKKNFHIIKPCVLYYCAPHALLFFKPRVVQA